MDDLYVDSIIDRYKHPTNQGWIQNGVVKRAHNASCGDMFEVSLSFMNDRVVEAKWKGDGCAISTVSVDTFCEWAIGKSQKQIQEYDKLQIQQLTEIHAITPAREKCLYLPLTLH